LSRILFHGFVFDFGTCGGSWFSGLAGSQELELELLSLTFQIGKPVNIG
jgi:hypothetical protein